MQEFASTVHEGKNKWHCKLKQISTTAESMNPSAVKATPTGIKQRPSVEGDFKPSPGKCQVHGIHDERR